MRKNGLIYFFSIISLALCSIIIVPLIKILTSTNISILLDTLKEYEVYNSILRTLRASIYASIFGLVTGVPLAYILARVNFKGRELVESIIDIPIIIPHSAAGIALLGVFGNKFFLGAFFNKIGISFVGTEWGIALAMFFVSIPFLINSSKEGFKLVHSKYENVAMSLGATRWEAFFDITLPLALKSVLSGFLMMWGRGISEFGAVIILAYHPMTAAVQIFERFEAYGLKYARPVAVLLILLCLCIFVLFRLIIKARTVKSL